MTIILFTNFAWSYPLFLWLTPQDKLESGFYRFNLGLSIIIGFFGVCISYFISNMNFLEFIMLPNFIFTFSWLGLLSIITWYYWKEDKYPLFVVTIISIFGLWVSCVTAVGLQLSILNISGFIIGTLTLSSVVFAMILGHWYLNVTNLSIVFIRQSVITLGIILVLRFLWNSWSISNSTLVHMYSGEIQIINYLQSFDGIFLWIAILFGIVGALIINFMTYKTVKIHSTQSATGLLYVNLVMILMAEIIFKYYMIQAGLIL